MDSRIFRFKKICFSEDTFTELLMSLLDNDFNELDENF